MHMKLLYDNKHVAFLKTNNYGRRLSILQIIYSYFTTYITIPLSIHVHLRMGITPNHGVKIRCQPDRSTNGYHMHPKTPQESLSIYPPYNQNNADLLVIQFPRYLLHPALHSLHSPPSHYPHHPSPLLYLHFSHHQTPLADPPMPSTTTHQLDTHFQLS